VLLALAIGVHAYLMTQTYVTARDSVGFARYSLRLLGSVGLLPTPIHQMAGEPPLLALGDVLKDEKQPPAYPLTVAVAALVSGPLTPENVAHQMLWCCQLAASVAGILIVFPVYWLGRSLYSKNAGFAAAALFQVLPVPAHITSDGLTDALYLLGVATAMLLAVRALAQPTVGRFLVTGLACGATYLVRPEGVLPGLAAIASALFWCLRGRWKCSHLAAWITAWGIGAMLVSAPYMVLIGSVSNKPSVKGVWDKLEHQRMRLLGKHAGVDAVPQAGSAAIIGATYIPGLSGNKTLWTVTAIARETTKGLNYVVAGLALAGLWASRRRLADPAFGVILAFAALDLGTVALLGSMSEYVSERHVLPLVLVGCLLAGRGLAVSGAQLSGSPAIRGAITPRQAAIGLLIVTMLGSLPATLKPLHPHRVGHRYAGEYLAKQITPTDTVVDPFEWALYFCGRGLLSIPPDRPDAKTEWAVWVEPSGDAKRDHSPESRNERMKYAEAIVRHPQSVCVWHYPENGPVEKAQVRVYRRQLR
jgi:hypothetical protein